MKKQIIATLIIILISLSKSQNNNIDRFINECIQYELENLIGIKSCVPIYDSLSSIKGYAKMLKDAKKVSVKCGSQYLMMSFIGFFAWFILF